MHATGRDGRLGHPHARTITAGRTLCTARRAGRSDATPGAILITRSPPAGHPTPWAAGADPGARTRGATPLEYAIHHGCTQVVDLLAGHGIVPQALWTYAACGRLDLVRACFDADGRLRPDAAASRPNPADAGLGITHRIPATDDPEEIIAEAFVHACQHGRTEVVRWFLDLGVRPDVAPYLGKTGLHWAIPDRHLEVIRLLLERGADPSIRDEMLHADADATLHVYFATRWHDPVTQQLHDLLESRSH
jgi:hypothetical protein